MFYLECIYVLLKYFIRCIIIEFTYYEYAYLFIMYIHKN